MNTKTKPRLIYLVVQILPGASPRDIPQERRGILTGSGTLVPVSCDGYYASREDAEGVADWLKELHPKLATHVVEIVYTAEAKT